MNIFSFRLYYITLSMLLFFCSCTKNNENNEPRLRECDRSLGNLCPNNTNADYCLFGIKWGASPEFDNAGPNASGPGLASGVISYSFQTTVTTVILISNFMPL